MTTKRKSNENAASSKIPRLTSLSQSNTSLADIVDSKVRSFCDKELMGKLISDKLQQFLPELTKSVEEAVSVSIRAFMGEIKDTIIGSFASNAPPPPPPNPQPPMNEITPRYMGQLERFASQRMRPYYQWVRHRGLITIFQNGLELEDPCIPRKFAENVSGNDAERIIEVKKKMSINNVSNEIEILKIYASDDEERVNKIDNNANSFINNLPNDFDKENANTFYQKLINKDKSKTEKIWKRKNDFLSSNKYLIPISKLITLEGKSQFYKKANKNVNFNNKYSEKPIETGQYQQQYYNTNSFDQSYVGNLNNERNHNNYRSGYGSYNSYKNTNISSNRHQYKKPYSQVVKFNDESLYMDNHNFP